MHTIFYTKTDESPLFATYSLLPIFRFFCKSSNINFEVKDISLCGRILSMFCNYSDDLKFLGEITQKNDANIIKLPNISASLVQLKTAIKELKSQGFDIPDFIDNPTNENEKIIKEKYQKILGSAVNPVLREGNSIRLAPKAVKNYAKANPHFMEKWTKDNKTRVSSMKEGDFYANEKSCILDKDDNLKIILTCKNGEVKTLKNDIKVNKGDIIDSTFMSISSLKKYIKEEIKNTKKDELLLSIHLKATMMKVSDPEIFGACIEVFFEELFIKYKEIFDSLNVNKNNGIGDLYTKIQTLDMSIQKNIKEDIEKILNNKANLAMVDSSKGITNLHVPNNVIIDSSMPLMIRFGGKMYDKNGNMQETNALIPDRSYAQIYQSVIDDCKENGTLDVANLGTVINIGLMAKKAEEYGSHDKTFILENDGIIEIKNSQDKTLLACKVEKGDIFRACLTKDIAIDNWIKLTTDHAIDSKLPTIFWLDENRAHDQNLKIKIKSFLEKRSLTNVKIQILNPKEATKLSLKTIREGKDIISATGNVVRDYLTDLFPILELGTSSKMLSIVPLMNGGGLFETGAGGTAPMLLEQFFKENHFIWDSLGEFIALFASLEFLAKNEKNKKIEVLAMTLDKAIENILLQNKSPKPNCGELDTRGNHFYLAYFWAKELVNQDKNKDLQSEFITTYSELEKNKEKILKELKSVQGKEVKINGYFNPSENDLNKSMRPSKIFNKIIN